MWAAIVSIFQALPGIEKIINLLMSTFTKTPEQKKEASDAAVSQEEQKFEDTNRPS